MTALTQTQCVWLTVDRDAENTNCRRVKTEFFAFPVRNLEQLHRCTLHQEDRVVVRVSHHWSQERPQLDGSHLSLGEGDVGAAGKGDLWRTVVESHDIDSNDGRR